jgi:hypothetical protein
MCRPEIIGERRDTYSTVDVRYSQRSVCSIQCSGEVTELALWWEKERRRRCVAQVDACLTRVASCTLSSQRVLFLLLNVLNKHGFLVDGRRLERGADAPQDRR